MISFGALYGRAATWRRAWYTRHPERRARLACPVVSIGNLVVGGSGKTPLTAYVAGLLRDAGERPVILSRGYGRRIATAAPLVVSDGARLLAPVHESGDEPQMLGRLLAGVPVVVSARRADAGRLALQRFDPTVFLLDDGFQHLALWRDLDLLVVSPGDLAGGLLPRGPLREPLAAARAAHALVVPGSEEDALRVSAALGVRPAFTMQRRAGTPQPLPPPLQDEVTVAPAASGSRRTPDPADPAAGPVLAVAAIARPARFLATLGDLGVTVADHVLFRDHHWYTPADMLRVERRARACGAVAIVTTEKDAVRLEALPRTLPWMRVPLRVEVLPSSFGGWLLDRVEAARAHAAHTGSPARQ